MRLSTNSRRLAPNGEIVNLMQVTTSSAVDYFGNFVFFWFYFIDWVLNFYFMWSYLGGVAAAAGYAAMLFSLSINIFSTLLHYKAETELLAKKDVRVKIFNDVLTGIKTIKFYGWEVPFENLINIFRNIELKTLKKRSYLYAVYNISEKAGNFLVIFTYHYDYYISKFYFK